MPTALQKPTTSTLFIAQCSQRQQKTIVNREKRPKDYEEGERKRESERILFGDTRKFVA
jgi:hypothetical protein